ncbi:MAG: hypothetical protein WCV82_03855 [Candidatus Paceibacterota bacterium]|jgi:hypothetical protein
MQFETLTGRRKSKSVQPYLIDWDDVSLSKFQRRVKEFLHHYWKNHVVCEEFPVIGTRMRLDFYNVTRRIAIECDGEQHNQYNAHFHKGSFSLFQKQMDRDDKKKQWCDLNDITLVRVYEEDVPNLSAAFFKGLGVQL